MTSGNKKPFYDTSAIRDLLNATFDDEKLTTFCYDHFRKVYDKFSSGTSRVEKIQYLIEYCDRHHQFDKLLAEVERINPQQYNNFISSIKSDSQTSRLSFSTSKSQVEIIIRGNLSDFTPEIKIATIGALADILNIRHDQVTILQVKAGSIILHLEMPTEAAKQLITLYEANNLVIHNLEIQQVNIIKEPVSLISPNNNEDLIEQTTKVLTEFINQEKWTKAAYELDNEETLRAFYRTGDTEILYNWLIKLSSEVINKHPNLLLWQGNILTTYKSDYDNAMGCFQQAETLYRQSKDQKGIAKSQIWQSVASRMKGEAKEAVEIAEQGYENLLKVALDDRHILAWGIRHRGIAYAEAGNLATARDDLHNALERYETEQDDFMVALCYHDLAVLDEREGQLRPAKRYYKQALDIWKQLGDHEPDKLNTQIGLSKIQIEQGSTKNAITSLENSVKAAEKLKNLRLKAYAQATLGDAYFRGKNYHLAVNAYEKSTELAEQIPDKKRQLENKIKINDCQFYLLQQPINQAREAGQKAKEMGLSPQVGEALLVQAKFHIGAGRYSVGVDLLDDIKKSELFKDHKHKILETQLRLIDAWVHQDRMDKAIAECGVLETPNNKNFYSSSLRQTITDVQTSLNLLIKKGDTPQKIKDNLNLLLKKSH